MSPCYSLFAFALMSLVGCSGCNKGDPQPKGETPPPVAASASAAAHPGAVASAVSAAATPSSWPVPVGPRLAVIPGKGVGAIRFGATIPTIERLMEFACEVKSETLCSYNGRAVDFVLEGGQLTEIRLHRVERQNPHLPTATYGVFNGRLLSGASLGMLQNAAMELLGSAVRVEQVTSATPWNTVERHHYEGMVIEYDRLANGTVVLAGVVLRS